MSQDNNYESGQQATNSAPSEPLESERRPGDPIEASSSSGNLYRIGEVSRIAETKPFVLRYWETEFPMLQPVKSPKGHRLYRQQDVDTVLLIKRLLYDDGFTIAGARRHLREGDAAATHGPETLPAAREASPAPSAEPASSHARVFPAESPAAGRPLVQHTQILSGGRLTAEAPVVIDRKVLLDLRDALRSFLTLLESE